MATSPSSKPPPLERALIERAMRGDEKSFEVIVERYERAAFGLAYRMCHDRHLAADVTQEIFLQLYRNLSRYDSSRPFTPWFFRMATNTTINSLKLKQNRRTKVLSDLGEEGSSKAEELAVAADETAPEELSRNEQQTRLRALVAGLPEKYAAIVSLRYLQEMSVDEIAEALSMPNGTVKVRLFRARDLLRKRLERDGLLP